MDGTVKEGVAWVIQRSTGLQPPYPHIRKAGKRS